MSIYLFYGPGEVSKRAAYFKVKKEFTKESIIHLDFKKDTLEKLNIELVSNSLFFTKKLVVVENVLDKLDLEELSVNQDTTLLILAGNLRADSTLFKTAKKVKAQAVNFEAEKELSAFPFLDALIERRTSVYTELVKLLEEYGAMYILTMIFYLLRRNILPLPASDFARNKIIKQKKGFKTLDFANLYKEVLETEFSIKNGDLTDSVALTKLVHKII